MCEYINCYKNVRLFQVHVCVFNQNVFILRLHIVDWNESPVLPSGSSFSSSLDAEGRCCMCVCVSGGWGVLCDELIVVKAKQQPPWGKTWEPVRLWSRRVKSDAVFSCWHKQPILLGFTQLCHQGCDWVKCFWAEFTAGLYTGGIK